MQTQLSLSILSSNKLILVLLIVNMLRSSGTVNQLENQQHTQYEDSYTSETIVSNLQTIRTSCFDQIVMLLTFSIEDRNHWNHQQIKGSQPHYKDHHQNLKRDPYITFLTSLNLSTLVPFAFFAFYILIYLSILSQTTCFCIFCVNSGLNKVEINHQPFSKSINQSMALHTFVTCSFSGIMNFCTSEGQFVFKLNLY